jgi:hypothetical protein
MPSLRFAPARLFITFIHCLSQQAFLCSALLVLRRAARPESLPASRASEAAKLFTAYALISKMLHKPDFAVKIVAQPA